MFDELIKAPLIFSLPGVLSRDKRISRQVRLLDVAPTILDLLGIEAHVPFEGVSLKPLLRGKKGRIKAPKTSLLPPEIAYSEAMLYYFEKKSLTAYPWKLIFDMKTGEETFFNLAEDPAEKVNIVGRVNPSLALLEGALAKTVFAISDTWYIEMAGGDRENVFDLDISCTPRGRSGGFGMSRLLDVNQSIVEPIEMARATMTNAHIGIKGLRVKEPVTLAFKLGGDQTSMRLDLEIGGRAATKQTFIGKTMTNPVTMPFIEKDSREDQSDKGQPVSKPKPPYFLIWRSGAQYGEDTSIELDEETKQELRSLGYIQ
jgi:hypothetical protein